MLIRLFLRRSNVEFTTGAWFTGGVILGFATCEPHDSANRVYATRTTNGSASSIRQLYMLQISSFLFFDNH